MRTAANRCYAAVKIKKERNPFARKSICSAHRQNSRNRARQDFEVKQAAPSACVLTIHQHPLLVADIAPARNLPETGDARCEQVVIWQVPPIDRSFSVNDRSRTYERHIANQHVEQLRKFIDAQAPYQTPEWRDAWVGSSLDHRECLPIVTPPVSKLDDRRTTGSGIHRTKLDDAKWNSKSSAPLLQIEHRAGRREFHEQRDQ